MHVLKTLIYKQYQINNSIKLGSPIDVNVTAHVTTISGVSEVSMDYTIDLYLRQFWQDRRLAFDSLNNDGTRSSLTVGIDMVKAIWVPGKSARQPAYSEFQILLFRHFLSKREEELFPRHHQSQFLSTD